MLRPRFLALLGLGFVGCASGCPHSDAQSGPSQSTQAEPAAPSAEPPVLASGPAADAASPPSASGQCPTAETALTHAEVQAAQRTAKTELDGPASLALGDQLELRVRNADTGPHCGYHPGGNNGCAAFFWHITLTASDGQVFTNDHRWPGQMCTQAIVSPRWITLAPGESATVTLDTAQALTTPAASSSIRSDVRQAPKQAKLRPGTYQVRVRGPGIDVGRELTITPR